jgi:hypothetical protein
MKYTIHGFSQDIAIKLKLDSDGLLLLRWFVDFRDTEKMEAIVIDKKPYYWVSYSKVISDMPIISDKEDTIYRKFKRLVESGVLKIHTTREKLNNGKFKTYAYYCMGENYSSLLSFTPIYNTDIKDTDESLGKKSEEYSEKNPSGHSEKSPYNIDLLSSSYSSIKKPHTPKKPKTPKPKKTFVWEKLSQDIILVLGEKITDDKLTKLVKFQGEEKIREYLSKWDLYKEHADSQTGYFINSVEINRPAPAPKPKLMPATKLPQYMDFEQREYNEDDMEKFYANLNS